jgi:hypothetical protein
MAATPVKAAFRTKGQAVNAIHRKAGRRAAGLRLVAEAAKIAESTLESWCNAELERERGELLLLDLSDGTREEADAAFRRAIDIAMWKPARTGPPAR